MRAHTPLVTLIATAFVSSIWMKVAIAQTPLEPPEEQLDEIVVRAARIGATASAIAGTVSIIDAETIVQQAAISDDLYSVLSITVPGFSPSIQKLTGRSETLRGRNPLYLVDGVPQHNALRDGSRDGHSFDLDFIERIEVINGSNAIQGVGATGGVVNTVTVSPESNSGWNTRIRARLLSSDDFDSDSLGYKASVLAMHGGEDVDVALGIALHERGLFIDDNGNPVGMFPTQGDIMDSTSVNIFGKVTWRYAPEGAATLVFNDFDLERNGDFRPVLGDRAADIPTGTIEGDPSADVGDPARNENRLISLTVNQGNVLGGELEAQIYDQSFEGLFEGGEFGGFFRLTPDGDPFLDQSAIVSDKFGIKTTYNKSFDRLALTLGLDFFEDSSAQVLAQSGREWVPETDFRSIAPFLQLGYEVSDKLSVSGGLRTEFASLEVDDYVTIAAANSTPVAGGDPDFDETLFNLGVIYRINDSFTVYGAFSEGFTMPDVGRVLRAVNTPGQDVDNLFALEPIVTDNVELGVEWQRGGFTGRLAAFRSQADNGARLILNDAGVFEVQRQETDIDGFEVVAEYALESSQVIGANYSNADGQFDSDGIGGVDTDLDGVNIGPNRLNLYAYGPLAQVITWRVTLSYLEDRDFRGPAAPVNRDFDGYWIANAFANWDTRSGQLYLGVENLFNEGYFTYFAQTEPGARADTFFRGNGRTLTLGWDYTF
ncbi:MAG: TonB-dependent receptor [Pseudomonadota bacterium]